jgi:hypothetical protein
MVTGSKFDKNLDVAEIAKRVRKDIAEAVKAGKMPKGLKCSTRINRFSGGSSIDISIEALPVSFKVWDRAFVRFDVANKGMVYYEGARLTKEARTLLDTLEALLNAYNRQDIDTQTDYFNVRFYGHVDYNYKATDPDRARAEKEIAYEDAREVWRAAWGKTPEGTDPYDPDPSAIPPGAEQDAAVKLLAARKALHQFEASHP